MILKLGLRQQAMEINKIYMNHDPEMTLTHLRQGQLRSLMYKSEREELVKCN